MDKQLQISYKPKIETLMKVSKYLLLNLKFIKYGPIFFICLLALNIWSSHASLKDGVDYEYKPGEYIGFLIFPILVAFIYFRSLSAMKKSILNNKRNFETQKITFNSTSYIQEGETFKMESFWNETYEIKETKDWFLIYPKKNSAFPIIKSDLSSREYDDLKALFLSLPIKKNLK